MTDAPLTDPLVTGLNPSQVEAVTYGDGPLLVLAGAGSGKTRVLTHRIAWLVNRLSVDPREILALTFTNKAAGEMAERVEGLLGAGASGAWLGTFHAIALRILRRHGNLLDVGSSFAIYDTDDQRKLAKKVVEELKLDPKKYNPNGLLAGAQRAKDEGLGPDDAAPGCHDRWSEVMRDFYRLYQKKLKEARALDFGDMLIGVLHLFSNHLEVADQYARRFRHVLIDEYQDTNRVQSLIAKRLASHWGNICVVGDDDQSIYGWRGADIDNILSFEAAFPGAHVVKLEQNYRSTAAILDAATSVITRNLGRHEKTLWTERDGGEAVTLHAAETEREEAAWIANNVLSLQAGGAQLGDVTILYRTHALSRPLEDALFDRDIPYGVYGGLRFYERKEIKDLLSFLRLTVNPGDPVALTRVINLPPRGIGAKTVEVISSEAARRGVDMWEAARAVVEEGVLTARAARAVGGFIRLVEGWNDEENTLAGTLERILEETGYRALLERDRDEKGQDRLENIVELLNAADDFDEEGDGVAAHFLDRAALVSDMDRGEDSPAAVTLMTIHSAKGLEYPNVFIAGMEEGVFPHSLSSSSPEELEEERRLCYVAITRAKDRLFMSRSRNRTIYGTYTERRRPSRFLDELPEELRTRDWMPPPPQAPAPSYEEPEFIADEDGDDGGSYYLPEPEEAHYQSGMGVRHSRYGVGRVVEVSGEGPNAKVVVEFGDRSRRKFIAGIAGMEIRT